MRMHNPPHPGEVPKAGALPELGLTVGQFAEHLGVSRPHLSRVLQLPRMLIAALFLFAAGTIHAEMDGHSLLKFQLEAEAYNADPASANRYRAGLFYGYIQGVLDALNKRSVCFTDCRCELEVVIGKHYQQHPEDLDKPAGPVLARLFERQYPCISQ